MGIREHTQWAMLSSVPHDKVIAALTDFGDEPSRIWPETSHPSVYRIHALGDTWAVNKLQQPGSTPVDVHDLDRF